jgi:hypothetical protein
LSSDEEKDEKKKERNENGHLRRPEAYCRIGVSTKRHGS